MLEYEVDLYIMRERIVDLPCTAPRAVHPVAWPRQFCIRVSVFLNVLLTTQHNLNVSQIRPFIENEEIFRKICHGGTTWNPIPRSTTMTDLYFFLGGIIVKYRMFFVGHPG